MNRVGSLYLFICAVVMASGVGVPAASAQSGDVVQRLVEYGRMPERQARQTVRAVDEVLEQNAESGGNRYDTIRQIVGRTMFSHPGRTREVYEQRLAQTLDRMRDGLDPQLLAALFPAEENSAVLCADRFGVSMQQCDALIAAATGERAALPFAAADDGRALQRALRSERSARRHARRIASKVEEVMTGVPRILTRDERGRAILSLLQSCPGALGSRESQIRAWHVGPTEGLVRCLAQEIADERTPEQAVERARLVFGMNQGEAEAFLRWGAPALYERPEPAPAPAPAAAPAPPAAPTQPAAPAPSGSAADRWLSQAREHFQARRFPQAAAAYGEAARAEPTNAAAHAGLGAAHLAMGNAPQAVAAYQQAVRHNASNAGFWTALARAQSRAGDRASAIQSLQRALQIDPQNQAAQRGLRALGGTPPSSPAAQPAPPAPPVPVPYPNTPSREDIISVMRPLQSQIQACHPSYDGQVRFNVTVRGETGEVSDARIDGELADTPEGACMQNVVQGVRFPRFQRETLEIAYPYAL